MLHTRSKKESRKRIKEGMQKSHRYQRTVWLVWLDSWSVNNDLFGPKLVSERSCALGALERTPPPGVDRVG